MTMLRVKLERLVWLCGILVWASCAPAAQAPEEAPRMIFNSDGCSLTLSIYEPVITPDQLSRVINELEGSQVDVFAWCPNLGGDAYTYPTQVAEVAYGDNVSEEEWARNHPRMKWQARNVRGFLEAGHDPVRILSARTRDLGKKFWVSLRMNDPHEDDVQRFGVKLSEFKKANPDLLVGPDFPRNIGGYAEKYGYTYAFDYAREEVRRHQLAVIEELCTNYDLDGLELDFQRGPWYFKAGQEAAGMTAMNDFLRSVRERTGDISRSKGRSFTVSVRVPAQIEQSEALGLDVTGWIREKWVDIVTVMDSGYLDMNADVEAYVGAAQGTGVRVAAGLETYTRGYGHASLDMLRAAAAGYYQEGADALYLFNFDCHRRSRGNESVTDLTYGPYDADEMRALHELHAPELIAHQDKHYFVTRDLRGRKAGEGGTKQLPVDLKSGGSSEFRFTIGDDLEAARAGGRLQRTLLRLAVSAAEETARGLQVELNGMPLTPAGVRTALHSEENLREAEIPLFILEFQDPPLQLGRNRVRVVLSSASEGGTAGIEKIEALVDYGESPQVSDADPGGRHGAGE